MKNYIRLLMILSVLLLTNFTLAKTVIWTGLAGNELWSETANWEGNIIPTSSDTVIIPNDKTVRISSLGRICMQLKIGDFANFRVEEGGEVTIIGDVDLQSSSSINIIKGIVNLGGDFINTSSANIIFVDNSVMNYNGNDLQTISNRDYYNLNLSGTGVKNITGTIGIRGSFSSSAIIGTNIGTIDYKGFSSQTVTAFDYNHLIISNDKKGGIVTFETEIGINGILSLTAKNVIYDLITNKNTISYNGTNSQKITNFTGGYYNLQCENGIKQLGNGIDVNNNFTITSNSIVKTAGNILTIGGDFVNNGIFTPLSSETVRFSGQNTSKVIGNTTFKNLNINKENSTIIIEGNIEIDSKGSVSFENGTSILSITGNLTLLSIDGINTARIAEIPSGSVVMGNVTVQRHLPITTNILSWWHITNTVKNVSISDWQSFFPVSGNFTGKDVISTNAPNTWSIKTYDESQLTGGGIFEDGWKNIPESVNTETFSDGQGYRAYIVDSKTKSSAKDLSFTGEINQSDFTFPMTYTTSGVKNAKGYSFLGNPYPSAIDFSHESWVKNNVTNVLYSWDAELRVWRGWNNGSSYNGGTSIIPAGQGFWVEAIGTPTLTVKESAKVENSVSLQKIAQTENNISVSLERIGSDELVKTDIRISNLATNEYDKEYDMSYLSRNLFTEFNSTPLLDIASETKDGKKVFINYLPITHQEIIPLHLTVTSSKEHRLTVSKENFTLLNTDVYLIDNFLNKQLLIEKVTNYTFDSQLGVNNRFSIKINNQIVLQTESFTKNGEYTIYPNPASSNGFIIKGIQSYEDVMVTITDMLGNTVYDRIIKNNSSGFSKQINFKNPLETGVYFVTFTTSENKTIQKVIIE